LDTRTSEERLVLKAQAGDTRAFEVLYRAYQPSLIRFAIRLTGVEATAQDAVQDAWIMVARSLGDLKAPHMFRARIFKAVRWRVLDQLRKRKFEPMPLNEEAEAVSSAPMKRQQLATSDQLVTLVDSLPEVERQAVYLFYLEELKCEEIAQVLDVPAGTVKSRLNRARSRLMAEAEGDMA